MRRVALDLGKRQTTYCEVSGGEVVQRATVSQVQSLEPLLGPERPRAVVAIEACREAWYVHDLLVGWGNDVVLVDTTRSKRLGIGQHGRKTDRIDAEVLARALEENRLPQAHVLSPKRRELRRVLGVRRALVESRARLVVTVRGLVREQNGKVPSCATEHFVERIREQKLESELSELVEPLVTLLDGINEQLRESEERLAKLCQAEPVVALLTTAPGVGTVVSACFVSVVDEARRFTHAHQLESYLGLVPRESTTGGKRRLGGITKQGNSYLRALLIQAAWTILRTSNKNDPLYLWGKAVAERRGKRIAVVAVARRLTGVLWAMWRDDAVYDAEHLARRGSNGLRRAVQALEYRQEALGKAAKKSSVLKCSSTGTSKSKRRTARTPRKKSIAAPAA